jgi:hypothetical protein
VKATILIGDVLERLRELPAASVFNEVIVLSSDQPWGTSAQEKEEACAGAGKLSGQNNSAPRKEPMTTGGCKQVDDGCALEANDR